MEEGASDDNLQPPMKDLRRPDQHPDGVITPQRDDLHVWEYSVRIQKRPARLARADTLWNELPPKARVRGQLHVA